jgi:hypothetical protein
MYHYILKLYIHCPVRNFANQMKDIKMELLSNN